MNFKKKLLKYCQDRIDHLNHLIDIDYDDRHGCYERRTEIQQLVIWIKERA